MLRCIRKVFGLIHHPPGRPLPVSDAVLNIHAAGKEDSNKWRYDLYDEAGLDRLKAILVESIEFQRA